VIAGADLWSVLRGGEGFMRPVEVCAFPPFRQKAAKGWGTAVSSFNRCTAASDLLRDFGKHEPVALI
jgi:hypothetical protein